VAGTGIRPGLERIRGLLERMDNPQEGLPVIHVAGTNGKGSTSCIIASVLKAAGYKVGSFTSPHIHSYQERITINGKPISGQDFLTCLRKVEAAVGKLLVEGYERPTEFEVLTAVAFAFFADQQLDIAVLEAGMGGRYDSTNIVHPLLAVITRVEFDHTQYLGNTIVEIAYNKAGIIKPGIEVVIGPLRPEALEVIKTECREKDAILYRAGHHVTVQPTGISTLEGQTVKVSAPYVDPGEVFLSLAGDYQLENLKTAMMVLSRLVARGWDLPVSAVKQALGELTWPGRMEKLSDDPMVVVDAAHNSDGAKALARALDSVLPGKSRILVCGVLDDKDGEAILGSLVSRTRMCVVTRPESDRAQKWREKTAIAYRLFPRVVEAEDIEQALSTAVNELQREEYILVTGSFYLVDRVRRYFTRN